MIRIGQNWSELTRFHQIWSDSIRILRCHIHESNLERKWSHLIRFDQISSDLTTFDQNSSAPYARISSRMEMIRFDQIGPDWPERTLLGENYFEKELFWERTISTQNYSERELFFLSLFSFPLRSHTIRRPWDPPMTEWTISRENYFEILQGTGLVLYSRIVPCLQCAHFWSMWLRLLYP